MYIDRLVLSGFRYEDRHAIAAGLRGELGQLLAEPGAARQLVSQGNLAHLNVSSTRIEPGTNPTRVGAVVARGISREIKL